MFHDKDGLFFKRNDNGSVTITKTSDGKTPDVANIAFTQTVAEGSWCSVVLNMSAFGERPGDWYAWMRHHRGEEDLLAAIAGQPAPSFDCPACNVGNPGVYIKDGRMVCRHRPEEKGESNGDG